jgi:hypothetical protein
MAQSDFAANAYARVLGAYDVVQNPRTIDLGHIACSAIITGLCFLAIGIIHRAIAVFFNRVCTS